MNQCVNYANLEYFRSVRFGLLLFEILPYVETKSSPYVCDVASVTKPLIGFSLNSVLYLYNMLSGKREFRENWFTDSHTWRKSVNKILSVISVLEIR